MEVTEKKTILWVDDEPRNLKFNVEELANGIKAVGWKVEFVNTVDAAWSYFEEHQSELLGVILDISMPPGMFKLEDPHGLRVGIRLYEKIRQRCPDLKVAFFTNLSDIKVIDRLSKEPNCLYAKKDDFLPCMFAEAVFEFFVAPTEHADAADQAARLYLQGVFYNRLDQAGVAQKFLRRAVQLDSQNGEYLFELAVATANVHEYHEALDLFEKSYTHSSGILKTQPCAHAGDYLLMHEQFVQAIDWYERGLKHDKKDSRLWFGLASAHDGLKGFDIAANFYRKAAKLDPMHADAWFRWGCALAELRRHKAAMRMFKRAAQLDARRWRTYYNLGISYYCLNQSRNMVKAFTQAMDVMKFGKETAGACLRMEYLLKVKGKNKEATLAHKRALQLQPQRVPERRKVSPLPVTDFKQGVVATP